MKRWMRILFIGVVFVGLAVIFLTPSLTGECSDQLIMCLEENASLGFWSKLWHTLTCVYYNVICVLGGLFN